MLNVRLSKELEEFLESRSKNKSKYVRDLISRDMLENREIDPKREYDKCSKNLLYFVENYCYIKDLNGSKKAFEPYQFQKEILQDLSNNEWLLIVKSRQLGITTILAIYSLWKVLFHSEISVSYGSPKKDMNSIFLNERVSFIYENLPDWMVKPKLRSKRFTKVFQNRSKLTEIPSRGHKGKSYDVAIFDEVSFIPEFVKMWSRTNMQINHPGGQVVITTNGIIKERENYDALKKFYKKSQFKNLEYSYLDHPKKDEDYKDEIVDGGIMTHEKFLKEHGGLVEIED